MRISTENPSLIDLKQLIPYYEGMLKETLTLILDRFESDTDYPFVDLKLNLITGEDFSSSDCADADFKGKNVVYAWIQGRGLEAVAGHIQWMERTLSVSNVEKELYLSRMRNLLEDVLSSMEKIRSKNDGRVCFCMDRCGIPLEVVDFKYIKPGSKIGDESNYSDLFYAKGLFKAASILGRDDIMDKASQYFLSVLKDIENNRFRTDQQSFDPKNNVRFQPGKISQGPMMIALLGLAEMGLAKDDIVYFDWAEKFILNIIQKHVNLGRIDGFEKFDFIECIDLGANPWEENGVVLCDPGHALEFIGLASKCLLAMRKHEKYSELLNRCEKLFPELLLHVFKLGFNNDAGGICKAYDLKNRKVLNSDMPWWSLPETMRAAAELLELFPSTSKRNEIMGVIAKCSNAFTSNYINPDLNMMAYQTRNASGELVDVIPATPDADPGYHTGLSIIDFIDALGNSV